MERDKSAKMAKWLFFAKLPVPQALSRPAHVLILEDKLNYFKFPLVDFKNSFCFGWQGSFWKPGV